MKNEKPAILIDAYSQIFRVFYAIGNLSRRDGFPTNALFGFARMLLQLEKEFSPSCGAMFFDCGKPEFRLELSREYKSNRPPMPENLKKQMPLLRELAELFGWQVCQCSNYEADDLIGAAVKSNMSKSFAVLSSDKDLSQLIDNHAFMLIPARSGGGFEKRGFEEVVSKFGVDPEQIIDYLSLLGDSSDAIDGVPKIGPKTAAAILNECGSLDKFFDDPELLKNAKQREKLLESAELIKRNQKLVALRTDWPESEVGNVETVLEKQPPQWEKIARFAMEYELKSILKDLPVDIDKVTAEMTDKVTDKSAVCTEKTEEITEKVTDKKIVYVDGDLFEWAAEQNKAAADQKENSDSASEQSTLF